MLLLQQSAVCMTFDRRCSLSHNEGHLHTIRINSCFALFTEYLLLGPTAIHSGEFDHILLIHTNKLSPTVYVDRQGLTIELY